jgi:GR25 family glycosyltransferase involved in LPS biosynthesis
MKLATFDDVTVFENLDDPGSAAAFLIKPGAARVLLERSTPFFMMNDDFVEARFLHRQRILALKPYPFLAGWGDTTIRDRGKIKLNLPTRLRREVYRAPLGVQRFIFQLKRWLECRLRPNLTQITPYKEPNCR